MKKAIQELKKEYFNFSKWYYHISFDHLEKSQLFNTDEQYTKGMNSVALGQHLSGIEIICFNLMTTHCHFLVHANGEDILRFFFYFKRRIKKQLIQDGNCPPPEDYFFKLVRVENKSQLESVIIYIARNPYKAMKDTVPSGYIWGTNYLIFSRITQLIDKVPLESLSTNVQRKTLNSRLSLPKDHLFNRPMGFILPESYIIKGKMNEVLESSWKYCSKIIKNMDAMIEIAEGIGEQLLITDYELDVIIDNSIQKFGVKKLWELSNDDKCRLAVTLRAKYKIDPKRIGRKLHIESRVIASLFK